MIVEDELLLRKQIAASLERMGADVTHVGDLAAARRMAEDLGFDYALLDVNLPDGLGTELLKEKALSGSTGVVVMTADGDVEGAVEAMKLGALDYLVKPFNATELPLVLGRVRKARQTARLDEYQRAETAPFYFGTALKPMESQLEKILAADRRMQVELAPVLIQGETGTGKTTIARWLHRNGPRSTQPIVEMNCSALPEQLAESELFGHERGAFTDARSARMGLFEAANGGSLFLDELSSLPLTLQAKVLTAIEDRRIRRLGGNREIPVDVRVIAASNCSLKELIASGAFREDLYHRLDLFRVTIPPLRERGEDVIELAGSLMEQLCNRHRLPPKTITDLGRKRILGYAWPGNVRELAHELERAIVFEEKQQLDFDHLLHGDPFDRPSAKLPKDVWFNEDFVFAESGFSLEASINHLIQHALKQTGKNVSAAARLLGVSRDYVRYRLAGQKQNEAPDQNEDTESTDTGDA